MKLFYLLEIDFGTVPAEIMKGQMKNSLGRTHVLEANLDNSSGMFNPAIRNAAENRQ